MTRSKKKQKSKDSKPSGLAAKNDIDVNALLVEAEAAIDSFNLEEASEKLKKIIEADSLHTKALEMLAGICIENAEWKEAQNLLKKCLSLSPEEGHSKYFSIAQLHEGEDSIAYYQKGISILEKEIENSENINPSKSSSKKSLSRSLSDAYCSVSELFMTDCCFVENAEEKCFQSIKSAISSDPTNPEAFQCLANFHLVKEQIEEAKEDMKKSLELWLPHHEALRDGNEEAIKLSETEDLIPSYDSRIQTAKLLTELEMFDEGTDILDGLIEEDDEVVEVWYLLGWMNYIQGDDYKLNAHYYLQKAREIHAKIGGEEADYITHVDELIEELKAQYPLDVLDNNTENVQELGSDIDSESENEMETQ